MRLHVKIFVIAMTLALAVLPSTGAAEERLQRLPRLRISVSQKTIVLGQQVTLDVLLTVPAGVASDRYTPPAVSGYKIVSSQRKTTTTQSVRTQLYRYLIQPSKTGLLSIGPARMQVGNEELRTKVLGLRVEKASAKKETAILQAPGYRTPEGPRPEVFLFAFSDKSSAWAGEQITVSWLLFTRSEVLKFEPKPPRIKGLWSEILFEPKTHFQYADARVDNKNYIVALVSRRALFATEAGLLTIDPLKAKIETLATALGRLEPMESNRLQVEILALPQSPASFEASHVGSFKLSTDIDRDQLPLGESLTLALRFAGKGALERMQPPVLDIPGFSFAVTSDHESIAGEVTNDGSVGGERVFRYWTTPTQAGKQQIPSISIPYFDPVMGQYRYMKSRPLSLVVSEAIVPASSHTGDKDELQPPLDTAQAQAQVTETSLRALLRLHPEYLLILLVLPLTLWAIVRILRRSRRGDTSSSASMLLQSTQSTQSTQARTQPQRQRSANAIARKHFQEASESIRHGNKQACFAALTSAVYGYLEEFTGQSLIAMTREQMLAHLAACKLDRVIVTHLLAALDSFDEVRFANSRNAPDKSLKQMQAALGSTKSLLSEVD